MKVRLFIVAALAVFLLPGTGRTATRNCAPLSFTLSMMHPVSTVEPCAGTISVNVRINGHPPYDSQSFGRANAGLVEYGGGAAIRLYQAGSHKGTLYVRAATTAPAPQSISIQLQRVGS